MLTLQAFCTHAVGSLVPTAWKPSHVVEVCCSLLSPLLPKLLSEFLEHLQVLVGHCGPCSEQHLLKVPH